MEYHSAADAEDAFRWGLTYIQAKTASAAKLKPSSYWVGDKAGERQMFDDFAAGRGAWYTAHSRAKSGLEALDKGDAGMAEVYLREAMWMYIFALEKRVQPEDLAALGRPSGKRGRKKK